MEVKYAHVSRGESLGRLQGSLSQCCPGCTWELVQAKSERSVYRLSQDGRDLYYVKVCDPRGPFARLRNRLRPKTGYEARMLARLADKGVRVPEVVDHVRLGALSALVTRAIPQGRDMHVLPPSEQAAILLELALELLSGNFSFPDMHPGNVILDEDGRPWFLDAYEIREHAFLRRRDAVRLFAQVLSRYEVPDSQLMGYLERLGHLPDLEACARQIVRRSRRVRRQVVTRWVRGLLRDRDLMQQFEGPGYRAYVMAGIELDVDAVLARHTANIESGTQVLKQQHKTQITLVERLCVKSYCRTRPAQQPYALRSWQGLLTLNMHGFATAPPVALVLMTDRSSALITGALAEPDLDQFLCCRYETLAPRKRYALARELGRIIGKLHAAAIYHADLKGCNLKIDPELPRFFLLDTDRVLQARSLSRSRRLKNLVQLNTSIPLKVGRPVRLAFLKAYAGVTGDDPRALLAAVWRRSVSEQVLYCTGEGDRRECWGEAAH